MVARSLDDLLQDIVVHAPGQWDNEHGPADWYAVSTEQDGGIVAYFRDENAAYRWRLAEINRILNG